MKEARINHNLDLLIAELRNRGYEIHHETLIAKDSSKHKELIEICEHFGFDIVQFSDYLVIKNNYGGSLTFII